MLPTGVALRGFRPQDLTGVAEMLRTVIPVHLLTPAGVGHWIAVESAGVPASYVVALAGERIVGWAEAQAFEDGSAWELVAVEPGSRGRGIGTALHAEVQGLFTRQRTRSVGTFALDSSPGGRFAERFGAERGDAEVWSSVDPRSVADAGGPEGSAVDGIASIRSVGEVLDRAPELWELYLYHFEEFSPGSDHASDHPYDEWVPKTLEHPNLEPRGSFVAVTTDDRIVSMTLFHTDLPARLAETEKTVTHPEWRARGLGRAVKLASIEWAAGAGIEKLMTSNAPGSTAHRLNEKLGYRTDATSHDYTRRFS